MDINECVTNTYVKLRYIPPARPAEPVSCKHVIITHKPELRIFNGQLSALEGRPKDELIGVDLHCSFVSTHQAGSVVLIAQVSAYIEWEMGFLSKQGNYVHEVHRLFVSVPMAHKIEGPRIALSMLSPWKVKLAGYAGQILVAFKKLRELESVMEKIMILQKGLCPDQIKAFVEELKGFEGVLNSRIRRNWGFESDIVKRIEHNLRDSPTFVGHVLT